MTSATMREFSDHPDAMFARVWHGETIEITRDDRVIAVISPPRDHYETLIARGLVIPSVNQLKAGDWDRFTHLAIPDGVDPPALLEESREDRDLFGVIDESGDLRTLDAIHLASAELVGPRLTAVVTYDRRMAEVARQMGLPVATPGME